MIYIAAFVIPLVVVGVIAWFLIEALETALDVEGDIQ